MDKFDPIFIDKLGYTYGLEAVDYLPFSFDETTASIEGKPLTCSTAPCTRDCKKCNPRHIFLAEGNKCVTECPSEEYYISTEPDGSRACKKRDFLFYVNFHRAFPIRLGEDNIIVHDIKKKVRVKAELPSGEN